MDHLDWILRFKDIADHHGLINNFSYNEYNRLN